jgi:hypothetical protein
VKADAALREKALDALLEADYEVERLIEVVAPDDPSGYHEAWFVETDGNGTFAYMKPRMKDGTPGLRVVPDP